MSDIDEVFEMGYAEYLFRMEMYEKRQVRLLEEKLYEAWLHRREVVAQKKDGKYVYKSFEDFKKIIKSVDNRKRCNFDKLRQLAIFSREFEKRG